jgi:hypothetical protein
LGGARLYRLRKMSFPRSYVTAAAKAGSENKPVIAALKRGATQNQGRDRVFPQPVKPCSDTDPAITQQFMVRFA